MYNDILWLTTQAAYLAVAVISFSLFLLIASFKGKGLVDWMLMLHDLMLSVMAVRFFLLDAFGVRASAEFRFTQWSLMILIGLTLFICLVREHIEYRRKYLKEDQD